MVRKRDERVDTETLLGMTGEGLSQEQAPQERKERADQTIARAGAKGNTSAPREKTAIPTGNASERDADVAHSRSERDVDLGEEMEGMVQVDEPSGEGRLEQDLGQA